MSLDSGAPPARRAKSLRWRIFDLALTIVLTFVIFTGLHNYVAQPFQVEQGSMTSTLEPGQYVLVDKISPHVAPYARGDIVVFVPPAALGEGDTPFIKRIVGLPGDAVALADGRVFINGQRLAEPYEMQPTLATSGESSWTVPDGSYFVLGDNRAASFDSRVFGPISLSRIVGRVLLRYWPASTFTLDFGSPPTLAQ